MNPVHLEIDDNQLLCNNACSSFFSHLGNKTHILFLSLQYITRQTKCHVTPGRLTEAVGAVGGAVSEGGVRGVT